MQRFVVFFVQTTVNTLYLTTSKGNPKKFCVMHGRDENFFLRFPENKNKNWILHLLISKSDSAYLWKLQSKISPFTCFLRDESNLGQTKIVFFFLSGYPLASSWNCPFFVNWNGHFWKKDTLFCLRNCHFGEKIDSYFSTINVSKVDEKLKFE